MHVHGLNCTLMQYCVFDYRWRHMTSVLFTVKFETINSTQCPQRAPSDIHYILELQNLHVEQLNSFLKH